MLREDLEHVKLELEKARKDVGDITEACVNFLNGSQRTFSDGLCLIGGTELANMSASL